LFSDLYSLLSDFPRQPGVEFIAADDAQGVTLPIADGKPPAFKVEMRGGRVHVRDFAHVEAEALEDGLRVADQSARAKFRAWMPRLVQNQDAGREMRKVPREVEGGRKSSRSRAEDQDVYVLHGTI
jgi:hypothetical protein